LVRKIDRRADEDREDVGNEALVALRHAGVRRRRSLRVAERVSLEIDDDVSQLGGNRIARTGGRQRAGAGIGIDAKARTPGGERVRYLHRALNATSRRALRGRDRGAPERNDKNYAGGNRRETARPPERRPTSATRRSDQA